MRGDNRRRVLMIAIFTVFMTNTVLWAQDVEVASSLNPVGSGARATGMGGAFIAVADDATAASWNPAGLIQLEKPEVSAVYSYLHRKQNYSNQQLNDFDIDNSMDSEGLNYASMALPFVLFNRNMTVSLNYQRLYEMNKELTFSLKYASITGSIFDSKSEFDQDGYLYALSPAIAVQVIPQLYIGATINFWDNFFGRNGWKRSQTQTLSGTLFDAPFEFKSITKEDVSFEGENAHFGFLWMINDSFTMGGVYKTSFDAGIEKKKTITDIERIDAFNSYEEDSTHSTRHFELRMPQSYGLGLSYRYSDNWTFAFDVYRTDWSKFVLADSNGNETNPVDGKSIRKGRLKDTTQLHLGTEYLFVRGKSVIPLRFGLVYDPEPQRGHLDEYYGVSLGTGIARGSIVVDLSYQYRMGNNLTGDFPDIENTDVDIDQHTIMLSVIIYLDGLLESLKGKDKETF